jgi:hypothetical protein
MADMGQDVLKTGLSNPAKSWLWDVVFTNPIGGGDADVLDTRCQSASIPGRSFGEILIPYKGTPGIRYPGKLQMTHNWSVTFVESTEDQKTYSALYNWHQAIQDAKTGVGGLDPTIKSDIYFRGQDQASNVWLTIKLIGCYISDMGEVSVSYDDTSAIRFPATFSYDRWEKVE